MYSYNLDKMPDLVNHDIVVEQFTKSNTDRMMFNAGRKKFIACKTPNKDDGILAIIPYQDGQEVGCIYIVTVTAADLQALYSQSAA